MSSLPLDFGYAIAPTAATWRIEVTSTYFNTMLSSWHPRAIHSEFDLTGQPFADWEIALLEERHPDDDIHLIDLEGWQVDFRVWRGFGHGYAVLLSVPWVSVGQPQWDAVSEGFHSAFNIPQVTRDLFPSGQTIAYVSGNGGTVGSFTELDDSSIGDTTLAVTGPMGNALKGEHRWTLAIEAPTGTRSTLAGSGGWDIAAAWYGTWHPGGGALRIAAAHTWVDGEGNWLGATRNNYWQLLSEYVFSVGNRIDLRAAFRFDQSTLADVSDDVVADPSFFLELGGRISLGRRSWFALTIGDNFPVEGVAPDFVLQLQFGMNFDTK
jgi:hypothetical protein